MKRVFKKIVEVSKIILWMIFNPRFLICFALGWMITNGWSYIALGVGIWCEIEWLTALSSAYLALLWIPATPEKLITLTLAVFFLRLFFPNDTKTLGVFRDLLETVKNKKKNRKKNNERNVNMNSDKIFDTVVLGSGYFSLGYAATHENTLIIEDTQLLDPNFYGTLSGFGMKSEKLCAKGAASLYNAFVNEGIVGEDRLAVNELEPALCRFVEGKAPNILLGTFCIGVKKTDCGYEISFCNNEGINRVLAKRVIDTRIACGNRMNILVAVKDQKEPELSAVSKAFYDDQRLIELDFDGNIDINDAKSKALDLVEDELAEAGARIVGTSYRMCGTPITEIYEDENEVLHVDERKFDGIFAAYEKGETWK